jgi:O-antigen/teichoic acid export membrane protein
MPPTGSLSRLNVHRLGGQLALFGLRAGTTGSKFLLALYTARYLSLSDLGVYGLLVGGTTIVPAVAGLGMTDFIVRKIVDLPAAEALPLIATRQALTLAIHLVGQPLVFLALFAFGGPVPLRFAVLAGLILLLENLGTEASDMLIARRRVFLANWLGFLRQGFWPLPVIAAGLLDERARTLDALLAGWLAALIATWLILLALLARHGRWRYVRPQWRWIRQGLRGSLMLYVKDVSGTISTFIDRFLISFFLGLELTGIYTLFWSITNVVHSLAVFSVLQTHIARLVAAGQGAAAAFRDLERRLQIETGTWALLIAACVGAATPFLVTLLDRPLLVANLPVFWLILAATLMRIAADGYGFVIYALHLDRAIATIALAGALASATLNTVLTPLAGLWGSAAAYLLTAGGLFGARFLASRIALRARDLPRP